MDLSVNQFYDEFISDKAPFGFAQLYELQDHKEIRAT